MKNLPLLLIALTFMLSSCNNDDEITLPQETQGYNMLLIGQVVLCKSVFSFVNSLYQTVFGTIASDF